MSEQPILKQICVKKSYDNDGDISYLKQDYFNDNPEYPLCTQEENEKYKAQDAKRLQAYYNDEWTFINVTTSGHVRLQHNGQTFSNELWDSLSGIESDCPDYIEEIVNEQIQSVISQALEQKIRIDAFLTIVEHNSE